ncbi:MAG: ATP-binding cassette domain-containing protein, partial [Rhodanobacter sp.]
MHATESIEPMPPSALRATEVSKAFISGHQCTQVLNRLSLSIDAAELTLISGPSGCGKSTLLATLSGLQHVDRGQVHALGSELGQLDPRALER